MGVRIDGTTRLVGVIGWPVAHSRSPRMHNAAFRALGLNFAYVPLPVAPDAVEAAVRGLPALGFAGANVTVPHKAAVVPYMDRLTPIARALRAVNTIVVEPDGRLLGDNTDGAGFIADLEAHGCKLGAGAEGAAAAPGSHPIRSALLLGAGGAARAVGYALAERGVSLAVANRTPGRATELCELIELALPGAAVTAHRLPNDLPSLAGSDLVVNATSLGMHGDEESMPWHPEIPFRAQQVVYDLVYPTGTGASSPPPTPLLRLAMIAGAEAIDGLGMLVHQGARAFELWTGQPAPVTVMRDAIRSR